MLKTNIGVHIQIDNIGKRFRYEWIFKGINTAFDNNEPTAILGQNGAGKSTFMKILSGQLTPSVGSIVFSEGDTKIEADRVFEYLSYAAPYIDLIEEYSLREMIDFHFNFKKRYTTRPAKSTKGIIELLNLPTNADKPIRFFSSGMKQRLKLALAICADTPLLLLDEPTTNLDAQGVAWYRNLLKEYTYTEGGAKKLIIIASNIEHDYDFCNKIINVSDYK